MAKKIKAPAAGAKGQPAAATPPAGPQVVDVVFWEVLKNVAKATSLTAPLEATVNLRVEKGRKVMPRLIVECECGGSWGALMGRSMFTCGHCEATYSIHTVTGEDGAVAATVRALPSPKKMAQGPRLVLPNNPKPRLV